VDGISSWPRVPGLWADLEYSRGTLYHTFYIGGRPQIVRFPVIPFLFTYTLPFSVLQPTLLYIRLRVEQYNGAKQEGLADD
jgi:hypothetical protein